MPIQVVPAVAKPDTNQASLNLSSGSLSSANKGISTTVNPETRAWLNAIKPDTKTDFSALKHVMAMPQGSQQKVPQLLGALKSHVDKAEQQRQLIAFELPSLNSPKPELHTSAVVGQDKGILISESADPNNNQLVDITISMAEQGKVTNETHLTFDKSTKAFKETTKKDPLLKVFKKNQYSPIDQNGKSLFPMFNKLNQ